MIEEIKRKDGVSYRAKIYWLDGYTISETFRTKTHAKEWERKKLMERDQIRATGIQIQDSILFEEFADRWMEQKIKTQYTFSTQKYYEQVLRLHLLPWFTGYKLRDLKIETGNRFVIHLKAQGKAPEGVNRILSVLRAMMNDAVKWQCIAQNPLSAIPTLKNTIKFDTFLTEQEIAQFLRANFHDPLYPLYVTALNTGMRRGELGGLQWDRVDFANGQIAITRIRDRWGLRDTTKNGKKRIVPINQEVRRVLFPLWQKQLGPYVFSNEDGTPIDIHHVRRDFLKAQKRAGFQTMIRFHDLRHTFASQFMMKGGNIYDLQKILGHYSLEMTQRYAHLSEDHLKDAISIVGFSGEPQEENSDHDGRNPNFIHRVL